MLTHIHVHTMYTVMSLCVKGTKVSSGIYGRSTCMRLEERTGLA